MQSGFGVDWLFPLILDFMSIYWIFCIIVGFVWMHLLLRSRIKQEFQMEFFGTVALSEVLQAKLSPCE